MRAITAAIKPSTGPTTNPAGGITTAIIENTNSIKPAPRKFFFNVAAIIKIIRPHAMFIIPRSPKLNQENAVNCQDNKLASNHKIPAIRIIIPAAIPST